MASLREEARYVLDDARDGVAWIAVWKTGRSWHCEIFYGVEYCEGNQRLHIPTHWECHDPDDLERLQEIYAEDENAILVNSYYCNLGDPDEMTLQSLVDALRWQYENASCALGTVLDELASSQKSAEGGDSDDGHQPAEGADQQERLEDELSVRASWNDLPDAPAKDRKRERIYSLRNLQSEQAIGAIRAGAVCNFFCRDG